MSEDTYNDPKAVKLNPAQIRFLNELLEQKQELKRELATLRASVATKLYELSVPTNEQRE